MPSASAVLAAREGGQEHPDESTVRLVTLDITSPNMVEPLYIVKNSAKQIVLQDNNYLPYYFTENLPPIKPGVKPEMTISFVQVSEKQEAALIETGNVYPWPTVTRKTWEITVDGSITKTSEFLFPMPVRKTILGSNGVIDVVCSEEDLDDVQFNPVIYTTDDHPGLKAYVG